MDLKTKEMRNFLLQSTKNKETGKFVHLKFCLILKKFRYFNVGRNAFKTKRNDSKNFI